MVNRNNASRSHRVERVSKELRASVMEYLSARYKGELPGMVTISHVQMPADLRSAKVFVSFLETGETNAAAGEAGGIEILQSWAPEIQDYLNDRLSLRYCPRLTFLLDRSSKKLMEIDRLLAKLK